MISDKMGRPSAVEVSLPSTQVILSSGEFKKEHPKLQIRQWRYENE
jgi:hypothetical protein